MPLENGTKLDSYVIQDILGAGGMGEVYRARDTRLDRDVAIKVMPRKFAEDDGALERFEREAKAVAALAHPNILAIYDFGTVDGAPYAVMELLEGDTLREHLRDGALPARKAATLARQVAEGLGAAHDRGIVHRDLKPENIFVTKKGRAKILDFGLAYDRGVGMLGDDVATAGPTVKKTLTDPGTVLGTVGYMSPEQVRGTKVDHRSDIFSFGCVLYEMLGGRRAFKRDTPAETMTAVLREEPESLDSVSSSISPALDRVVRRCLEKNPEERFQSTRDLAFAIDNAVSDSAVREAAGTADAIATQSARELAERKRAGSRSVWPVAVLALLVGLVAGYVLFRGGGDVSVSEPVRVRTLTVSGRDWQPTASPDGSIVAFTSNRDGTRRIWLKQLVGGGEEPLTEGPDEHPRFSPDGSSLLFVRDEGAVLSLYRQSLVGGQERKILEDVASADWSPDGERVAFLRNRGAAGERISFLGIANANGTGEEIIYEVKRTLSSIRWSPDGETIVAVENSLTGNNPDGKLVVLDAETRETRYLDPTGVGFPMAGLAWNADGSLILGMASVLLGDQGDTSSRFVRVDLDTGEIRTLFWSQYLFPIQGMRVDATIADIVAPEKMVFDQTFVRQGLREFARDGAETAMNENRVLTRTEGRDRQPVYSRDGRHVMFASNRSGNLDLWRMDLRTKQTQQLTDDAAQDWDPGFSPNGRQIVWSSDRSGNLEIWIANADGSGARQLSNDGADAENPTFTADGDWVVYWSANHSKRGVWKIRADGTDATRIVEGAYLQPEVSPDGKYAAYVYQELDKLRSFINVAEVATGEIVPFEIEVRSPPAAGNIILGRVRWLPDGSGLAYVGVDDQNRTGVFAQDFVPGKDTRDTRRPLAGFSDDYVSESFGISPDGNRLTLAILELTTRVMLAEGVPGVRPPR